jgi:hypothetical protein
VLRPLLENWPVAFFQIDHADTVAAELSDKNPLAIGIESKVIDSGANLSEGDLRLQLECSRIRRARRRQTQQRRHQDGDREQACLTADSR